MITQIEMKNHMECFGYEVKFDGESKDSIMCAKEGSPLLLIRWDEEQIRFYGQYSVNTIAKTNKGDFLRYLNSLTLKANFASYFMTENEEALAFAGKYFGEYDRRTFNDFVRCWEYDVIDVLYANNDTDLYLGNPEEYVHQIEQNSAWAQGD